jgi:hypothetical protein
MTTISPISSHFTSLQLAVPTCFNTLLVKPDMFGELIATPKKQANRKDPT